MVVYCTRENVQTNRDMIHMSKVILESWSSINFSQPTNEEEEEEELQEEEDTNTF